MQVQNYQETTQRVRKMKPIDVHTQSHVYMIKFRGSVLQVQGCKQEDLEINIVAQAIIIVHSKIICPDTYT